MKHPDTDRLVLHIGLPKTGTTWLQDVFFPHQETINYIDVAPQNYPSHQHPALVELVNISNIPSSDLDTLMLRQCRQTISLYLDERITLLSNENYFSGMPGTLSNTHVSNIARNLSSLYPHLRIILILRNQLPLLSSLYLQKLYNANECRSFSRFLIDGMTSLIPYLTFHDLVINWYEALGESNVYISTYEYFKRDPTQFLNDLSVFVGVEKPIFNCNNCVYANRSLSFYSASMVLLANRLCTIRAIQRWHCLRKQANLVRRHLIEFARLWIDPNIIYRYNLNTRLTYPYAKELEEYYSENNMRLCQLIHTDLKQLGYP